MNGGQAPVVQPVNTFGNNTSFGIGGAQGGIGGGGLGLGADTNKMFGATQQPATEFFGNTNNAGGSSLFGGNQQPQQAGFGLNINQPQNIGFSQLSNNNSNLFGANNNQSTSFGMTKPAGSLFGNVSTPVANNTGSLFGGFGNNNQNQAATNNTMGSALFGAVNNNLVTPTATTSLFGAPNTQNQGSLFGANNQQGSLFGAPTQQQPTNSLFGGFGSPNQLNTQSQGGSLFGAPNSGLMGQTGSLFNATTPNANLGFNLNSQNQNQNSLFQASNQDNSLFNQSNALPNQGNSQYEMLNKILLQLAESGAINQKSFKSSNEPTPFDLLISNVSTNNTSDLKKSSITDYERYHPSYTERE
jgi:nuclear pore complex protein Nup98-Nup96